MLDARTIEAITAAVDQDRLVDFAQAAISVPSFTGDEQAMAELMAETLTEMDTAVQWQQVEDGPRTCWAHTPVRAAGRR